MIKLTRMSNAVQRTPEKAISSPPFVLIIQNYAQFGYLERGFMVHGACSAVHVVQQEGMFCSSML